LTRVYWVMRGIAVIATRNTEWASVELDHRFSACTPSTNHQHTNPHSPPYDHKYEVVARSALLDCIIQRNYTVQASVLLLQNRIGTSVLGYSTRSTVYIYMQFTWYSYNCTSGKNEVRVFG
jgi:hypothetical protein